MNAFTLGPAILFCPADRPDRYDKAAARADAVILDLEDAVAPANRAAARESLRAHPLDPDRTIVRVNPVGSNDFSRDLSALSGTAYRTIMIAKTESRADVMVASEFDVVALCETAAGVVAANEIAAAANVVALMWGAEDLIASLGGSSSRGSDSSYRGVAATARSLVLLAAGAHGKAAIDAVHLDIDDLNGLRMEVADAVASGFVATACIHPHQVDVIRSGYRPTDDEVSYARGLLDAARTEPGVFRLDGTMIDAPMLRHAESILRRSKT